MSHEEGLVSLEAGVHLREDWLPSVKGQLAPCVKVLLTTFSSINKGDGDGSWPYSKENHFTNCIRIGTLEILLEAKCFGKKYLC
jgi:hypothetical protein